MIEASECKNCKQRLVPSRNSCPFCGSNESINLDLSGNGSVLSYTILQMPPEGFEPPVLLGLIELDGGANTLCLGHQESINSISIGSQVAITQDSEGRYIFTLKK